MHALSRRQLSGSGELGYSMFVWRSSEAFDEYTNSVPLVSDVEEVIVRSAVSGGARVVSDGGGCTVQLSVLGAGTASWSMVWSAQLGSGSYSLDGLHARFARQEEVRGVRLAVSDGSGVFEGWEEVTLHLGRAVDSGRVRVASSRALDVV